MFRTWFAALLRGVEGDRGEASKLRIERGELRIIKDGNMILRGKVQSGINSLSYWMDKLEKYYTEKTGMKLYPGSLNIELNEPFVLPSDVIRLEKDEYGGTVSVSFLPCRIYGRKAFIVRTDKNASGTGDHPLNIIEVITDVKLRDEYSLNDGDNAEVYI